MSRNIGAASLIGNEEKDLVQPQLDGVRTIDSETQIERVKQKKSDLTDIEPALDRSITRKFDKHIIPWLFGLWLFAFIDRSNIGNAKIDGLEKDLQLLGNKFNIVCYSIRCAYSC